MYQELKKLDMNKRKIGIGLILVGVGLSTISLFYADGYAPVRSVLYNIQNMYITVSPSRFVDPKEPKWEFVTAEEIAKENETDIYSDILGGDRKTMKEDPSRFAEYIQHNFRSDMTVEDITKAVISGTPMRLAKKEWKGERVIPYKSIATISVLLVLFGIGFLIFLK